MVLVEHFSWMNIANLMTWARPLVTIEDKSYLKCPSLRIYLISNPVGSVNSGHQLQFVPIMPSTTRNYSAD